MTEKKNILITGVAGFIGSSLAEKLTHSGHQVYGIDNFDPFYSRSIKESNLKDLLANPLFQFAEGDFSNTTLLDNFPNINLVIHLAAKPGVRPSLLQPQSFLENNINKTQILYAWMQEKGIKDLIFASSSSVYGNTSVAPFNENQAVSEPISIYALSKKAGELLSYTYHNLHQFNVINLRFFTVYGPRQRPDLAIHKFVKAIENNEKIHLFGDGSTSRDYTYIDDILQGILGAIQYLNQHQQVYEIVNLGSHTPIDLLGLVKNIEHALGKKANIEWEPMQAGDVDATYADISKAKELFQYAPNHPLSKGLESFVQWYRKNML